MVTKLNEKKNDVVTTLKWFQLLLDEIELPEDIRGLLEMAKCYVKSGSDHQEDRQAVLKTLDWCIEHVFYMLNNGWERETVKNAVTLRIAGEMYKEKEA